MELLAKIFSFIIISVFKVLIPIISTIFKFIFTGLAFIGRSAGLSIAKFTNDKSNELKVWNIKAVGLLIFSAAFLIYTIYRTIEIYKYNIFPSPFFLIPSLLAFAVLNKKGTVQNAPIIKQYKLSTISSLIIIITSVSGISGILFTFLFEKQPILTLILSMFLYLATIGIITYKQVTQEGQVKVIDLVNLAINSRSNTSQQEKTQQLIQNNAFILGAKKLTSTHTENINIVLPKVSRHQHMHIIGPTGTGKSILGMNLAVQDLINTKHGVIALEPTRDFVQGLRAVSQKIGRKYHYVDPTDMNSAVINPLDGDDYNEVAEINVSAFIGYLGRNANEFYKNKQKNGLRMAIKVAKYIKGNDATYDDLLEILRPSNNEYRLECMQQVPDDRVRADLNEYMLEFSDPKTLNNAIQNYNGLLDYLKELTSNEYIRNVICRKSTVSLRDIFNNGEVLLVSTAYGKLKSQGFVLGRLIITMLQSEVFARTEIEAAVRDKLPPIAVYIDEVQNYVSEPFAEIFEMARKAGLMMTIMHQGLAQLRAVSERLEQSIFDNARQKVIFGGINAEDTLMFAKKVGEDYKSVSSQSVSTFDVFSMGKSTSEQMRFEITPTEINRLKGFQTDTGEPAEVLMLLTVHNRFEYHIGLVSPLPRDLTNPPTELEFESLENSNFNTDSDSSITTENINEIDLNKISVENPNEDSENEDEAEISTVNNDAQNDQPAKKKKRVRSKKKKNNSNLGAADQTNTSNNNEITDSDTTTQANSDENTIVIEDHPKVDTNVDCEELTSTANNTSNSDEIDDLLNDLIEN